MRLLLEGRGSIKGSLVTMLRMLCNAIFISTRKVERIDSASVIITVVRERQ